MFKYLLFALTVISSMSTHASETRPSVAWLSFDIDTGDRTCMFPGWCVFGVSSELSAGGGSRSGYLSPYTTENGFMRFDLTVLSFNGNRDVTANAMQLSWAEFNPSTKEYRLRVFIPTKWTKNSSGKKSEDYSFASTDCEGKSTTLPLVVNCQSDAVTATVKLKELQLGKFQPLSKK